jgi:hypothetical protein
MIFLGNELKPGRSHLVISHEAPCAVCRLRRKSKKKNIREILGICKRTLGLQLRMQSLQNKTVMTFEVVLIYYALL